MVPAKSCVTNGRGKWREWTYLERGVFQRELARKGKVPSRTEQGRQTSKRPLQFGTVWHDGGRVATICFGLFEKGFSKGFAENIGGRRLVGLRASQNI